MFPTTPSDDAPVVPAQPLAAAVTRRRFAKLLPVALAAGLALTGGLASDVGRAAAAPGPAVAAQGATLRATADLNFRIGPGLGYQVLAVIPRGAQVVDHNEEIDGFRFVTFNDTRGWAAAQYLSAGSQVPPHAGPVIGTGVAAVDLNLRSGPGTGHPVLRVMAKGSQVELTDTVVDGFRYVYSQGLGGWAFDRYLAPFAGEGPYDPTVATATADLNLRAGPSLADRVLRVIPEGGRVQIGDGAANGYVEVTYDGTAGFAATAYLN